VATTAQINEVADLSGQNLRGLSYFKKLLPLLEPLHDAGCARDTAGNRTLHYDQYCCLILLQLFNPAVATLRLAGKGVVAGKDGMLVVGPAGKG
jgi:hypothetical protein